NSLSRSAARRRHFPSQHTRSGRRYRWSRFSASGRGVTEDPVRLCLVASLAQPGGNATCTNFFATEVVAKRLRLLHDLVPKAVRIAVLVNPENASKTTLREVQDAAPTIGLQIQILNARTIAEI